MTEDLAALEAFGLAVVMAGRAQPAEAAQQYRQALALDPGFAEARYNLANLYQAQGFLDEAETHYRAIPDGHPVFARAVCNLGVLLARRERLDEAVTCFEQALAGDGDMAAARYGLGMALLRLGRHGPAAKHFALLLARQPDHLEGREGLAVAMIGLGRIAEAAADLEALLAPRPDDGFILGNLGNALMRLGRFEEAERHLRRALDHDPGSARRHSNLGLMLHAAGRLGEAVAAYRAALAIEPDSPDLRVNYATALLARGDLAEGFAAFESRLACADSVLNQVALPAPLWDGTDADGRTILLHAEQGLGDVIQFARFIPLLADLGARPVLACKKAMLPLLSTVAGLSALIDSTQPPPPCDACLPLMSLPLRLGTTLATIPAAVPYLAAEPERVAHWGRRLAALPGRIKVGLAWQGNPTNAADATRSAPLSVLAPLADVPGVALYAIQKGPGSEQTGNQQDWLIDLGPDLDLDGAAFADTAAAMTHLDVVVTVDTAAAHLAGALARPVWVLLSHFPDWRWLAGRDDSPWYPTARLFRQPAPGDWPAVVRAVAQALAALARERQR